MAAKNSTQFHVPPHWSLAERLLHGSRADETGCRIWMRGKTATGYGRLYWKGGLRRAHRLAWEDAHGPIPEGIEVCHHCDVRACINVEHLFLGAHQDNMADMWRKGRGRYTPRRGAANGMTRLTHEQALAIFHATGMQQEIADAFGVDQTTVSDIKRKKTWRHLHAATD